MLPKKLAKSTIWGSLAALTMVVLPGTMTAISMVLTVAPTLGISKYTSAPAGVWASETSAPRTVSTLTPKVERPLMV